MSELPGSTRPHARHRPLARSERFLIAYAVLGGAAWTAVFFDGTIGGFVNGVIAFLVVGFGLTYVASRLDDRAHERARFPGESRAPAAARPERDRPPVSPAHLWSRRGAIALFFAGLTGCVIHRVALERKQLDLEFVFAALAVIIAVAAIIYLDRKALAAADAWRAERRAARDPQPTAGDAVSRADSESPAHEVTADPSARAQERLGKLTLAFTIVGFPLMAATLGSAGFVVYMALIVLLLAAQNRLRKKSRPGLQISSSPAERRRALERIRLARGPLSAVPPRPQRYMRVACLILVVIGTIGYVVMPLLNGATAEQWFRQALPYLIGLAFSLTILMLAERDQRALEHRWLRDQEESREAGAAR